VTPAAAVPRVAVGGVALRRGGILLVRRANPPARGMWSLPGGHVELGETLQDALVREIREETGLAVAVRDFIDWTERIDLHADPPYHFVIVDFLVDVPDGNADPVAGSDAAEAAWVSLDDLGSYRLTDGLVDFLADHGLLSS
jgi:8-oxo-dGTP diphosphatase